MARSISRSIRSMYSSLLALLLLPSYCHADYILSSYYLNNPSCSGSQLFQSASNGDLGYGACRPSPGGGSYFFSLRCVNASAYAQDLYVSAGCIGSPFYSSIGVFPSGCEQQTGGNSIQTACVVGTYTPPQNALLKLSWSDAATTCSTLSSSFVSPDSIQVSQVETCSTQGTYSGKETCNATHSFVKVWMSSTTCDSASSFQISNEKSLGCSMQVQGSSGPARAEIIICNITSSGGSPSPSPTQSPIVTMSPTATVTPTVSSSIGASASETSSPSPTTTVTPTVSSSIGASASETSSPSPTTTVTPTVSSSIGASASETSSPSSTISLSPTASNSASITTTISVSPLASAATASETPSATPTESPTATETPTVSPTVSVSLSPTSSLTATVSSSVIPTSTSTFKASPTPNTISAGYTLVSSCSSSFFSLQKDVTHIFACYTNGTRDDAIMSILIYNPDSVKMTIAQRRSKTTVSSYSLQTVYGTNSSSTLDLSTTTDAMSGSAGIPTESSEVWQRREIKCYNAENNVNGHCVLNVLSVSNSALLWITVYGKEAAAPNPPSETSPKAASDPFDANERMVVYIMAGLLSILGTAALCHACGFYELPCFNICCNGKNKGLTSKRPVFSSVYGATDDSIDHADRDRSDSDFVGSFDGIASSSPTAAADVVSAGGNGGGRGRAHSGGTLTLPFGTTVSRVQTKNPLRGAV